MIGGHPVSVHDEARILAVSAISGLIGKDPDFDATRHLAAICHLETSYGRGWRGAGVGSNNMGAIQAGSGWTGDTFVYTDTHPNPDGSSTPYRVAFRKYPTPQAGWDDLARVAFGGQLRRKVLIAAAMGDTRTVSQLMRETGYYEGFGATARDREHNHFLALRRGIYLADSAQGIEVPTGRPVGLPPTLRRADRGDHVRTLQRELQLAADGIFGPITEAQVEEYQRLHGLVVDGVVGPKTWTELFNDGYDPGD
jgi:peptidoglycan hydrolase-like protein with peptidoglycan-binding domain